MRSRHAILDEESVVVEEDSFRNSVDSIAKHFGKRGGREVVLEVAAQSAWIARELSKPGVKRSWPMPGS